MLDTFTFAFIERAVQILMGVGHPTMTNPAAIHLTYPDWVHSFVNWEKSYRDVEDRVRLVIDLARENVMCDGGGPFGAAVFDVEAGRLISVGVNLVVREHNSVLHAEMVALMMSGQRLSSHTLCGPGMPVHEVTTSCEPCAMCLGAVPWSGLVRVVCAARDEDARVIGMDEGEKPVNWIAGLEKRGIEVRRDVLRNEAAGILRQYKENGGFIYNGRSS